MTLVTTTKERISTDSVSGRVDLIKYTNGSGIEAWEFFNPKFMADLTKMYQFMDRENDLIYSFGNVKIFNKYRLNLDNQGEYCELFKSVYPNNEGQAIFRIGNGEVDGYASFVGNRLFLLEVIDAHTDHVYFETYARPD